MHDEGGLLDVGADAEEGEEPDAALQGRRAVQETAKIKKLRFLLKQKSV